MAAKKAHDARRQEEKNRAEIEEENRKHENLFNLRYHQDMTDRTEVQGMLRELREQQDAQRSQNEAKGAVMGETTEQQQTQQQGLNKAYADSVAQIASNASLLKDNYLDNYEHNLSNYYQQRRNQNTREAQIAMNTSDQWSKAADNATKALAGSLGVVAGNWGATGAPKKNQTTTLPEDFTQKMNQPPAPAPSIDFNPIGERMPQTPPTINWYDDVQKLLANRKRFLMPNPYEQR